MRRWAVIGTESKRSMFPSAADEEDSARAGALHRQTLLQNSSQYYRVRFLAGGIGRHASGCYEGMAQKIIIKI